MPIQLTATALLAFILGTVVSYLACDPRHWATATQSTILDHVTAEYCHPAPWSPERYAGRTTAIASLAVAAGLGPLAAAEVLKCEAEAFQASSYAILYPDAKQPEGTNFDLSARP